MRSGNANRGIDLAPALERGAAASAAQGRRPAPLILVLLVVAAAIVLFAFIARFFQDLPPPPPVAAMIPRVPLEIDTDPSGARVTADGHGLGFTPVRSSLPVGVHELEFELDGFAPLRRDIELVPGSPLSARLPLTAVPGALRVITDLENAEVTLDGQPLTGVEHEYDAETVAPGRHRLSISGEKGRASVAFEVRPAAAPIVDVPKASKVTMAVISRFGDSGSVVASEPAKIGLTRGPAVQAGPDAAPLPVEPGQHAELSGTNIAKQTVPVTHANVPSISVLAATQIGSLLVASGRDDVSVWLNGKESQRQPHNGKLYFWSLTPGMYVVRIARPGGMDRSMRVEVEKDKQAVAQFVAGAMPQTTVATHGAKPAPVVAASPRVSHPTVTPPTPTVRRPAPLPVTPVVQRPKPVAPSPVPVASAEPKAGPQGLVRFVIRTPGARVTVRQADVPHAPARAVASDSVRLPAGRWVVNASAPGFEPYSASFWVNAAGPADVFIRLTPQRTSKKSADDR